MRPEPFHPLPDSDPRLAAAREAARRIAARFNPEQIILFGSTARGESGPGSDLDLLVLVRQHDGLCELAGRMYLDMSGLGTPIDIVVMSLDRFHAEKDLVGSLARPVSREGRLLHERVA